MSLFGRLFGSPKERKIINLWEHKGWGNSIYFFDWEKRKLVGWLTPIPQKGDEVRERMKSGKIARFEIIKVEPCYDPVDMFFVYVKDIGYMEGGEK